MKLALFISNSRRSVADCRQGGESNPTNRFGLQPQPTVKFFSLQQRKPLQVWHGCDNKKRAVNTTHSDLLALKAVNTKLSLLSISLFIIELLSKNLIFYGNPVNSGKQYFHKGFEDQLFASEVMIQTKVKRKNPT